jgi:hypothetical protein
MPFQVCHFQLILQSIRIRIKLSIEAPTSRFPWAECAILFEFAIWILLEAIFKCGFSFDSLKGNMISIISGWGVRPSVKLGLAKEHLEIHVSKTTSIARRHANLLFLSLGHLLQIFWIISSDL